MSSSEIAEVVLFVSIMTLMFIGMCFTKHDDKENAGNYRCMDGEP
jgi:hypothetical protein